MLYKYEPPKRRLRIRNKIRFIVSLKQWTEKTVKELAKRKEQKNKGIENEVIQR